jgi:hypothetical protein
MQTPLNKFFKIFGYRMMIRVAGGIYACGATILCRRVSIHTHSYNAGMKIESLPLFSQ